MDEDDHIIALVTDSVNDHRLVDDSPEAEEVDEVDEKVGNQFSSKKYVEKNSDRNQSFYDSIVLERN